MPKLAITISGAVSLGSYEAGVLYELFTALAAHNKACDAQGAAEGKIFVDVLTGASAGGMSVVIAAQRMLLDAASLEDPLTNAFYMPWVKAISLDGLLADDSGVNKGRSILCSDCIDQISRKYLLSRYEQPAPPRIDPHPAADSQIHVGLAMSNLNGVDYGIPTSDGSQFLYTDFADHVIKPMASTMAYDNKAFWDEMRKDAVACGAFPFAFRMREILRQKGDYAGSEPLPADPQHFAYVDGGVFQNEPLGLAKNIVDALPAAGNGDGDRSYLYISPSLRDSMRDPAFSADKSNLFEEGMRLLAVIFGQARFQDWVQTQKTNRKIQHAQTFAVGLQQQLLSGTTNQQHLSQLNAAIAELQMPPSKTQHSRTSLARAGSLGIAPQYATLQKSIGSHGADEWLAAVEAVKSLGGHRAYDFMRVDSVVAQQKELASGALYAFAGFFDERYRQHDYDVGRCKAQALLAGGAGYIGKLRNYQPTSVTPQPGLANLQPKDLDSDLRVKFRDRIRSSLGDFLQQTGKTNVIARSIADWFIIKPMLDDWLEL
jgi:hypothetical protein